LQFNNPASTRNENSKYDNSTTKKLDQPLALAMRFPFHPARFRIARQRRRSCPGASCRAANTATSMPWAGLQEGNYILQ
jgi:hypothetical protein